MVRKLAAALAAGAAALALAAPASARVDTTGTICTTNGNHRCMSTRFFSLGSITISEPGGRTVTAATDGETTTVQLTGSNAPANRCIQAVASTYTLQVAHCSGDTGIDWFVTSSGDGFHINNVHYSGRVMAGDDVAGDAWVARPLGASGWFYVMEPLP